MSYRERILSSNLKNLVLISLIAALGLLSSAGAAAQTTLSTTAVNFGNVVASHSSVIEKITLKNTQAVSLSIGSIVGSGVPYALDPSTTCANPGSLGAGASCTIGVTLTPGAIGAAPAGTLTITTNATNSPQTITLNGTGVAPTTLNVTDLSFGNVVIGETSWTLTLTLKNNQLTPLAISSITLPSAVYTFGATMTCPNPGNLAAGATCTIPITLKPASWGAVPAGVLTINTNAINSPQNVPLYGTGIEPTVLSLTSLPFGNQVKGETSLIRSFTLKNEQSTALAISSITAPAGGYAIDPSTTCPNSGNLAAGATCTIGVTFTPSALGAAPAGSVSISTNASNTPQLVAVSGTGINPASLSASTVAFGFAVQGQTSPIKIVTLTNNQATATLTVSSLAISAGSPYAVDPSSTCLTPTVAAAGGTCTIALTFTPTTTGAAPNGTLTISSNASNSPQMVTLTGSGEVATTLSPTAIAFGAVAQSTVSATKTLTLKNNSAATLNITQLIFAGPFALDTSATTTCPIAGGTVSGTLAGGASCVIGVTFDPAALGATTGGQVTVIDSASNGPVQAALSGVGTAAATLSYPTLAFGNVVQGNTSAFKNILLTNNQAVNLNISTITAPAPYAISPGTTTCVAGTPVLPHANCTISLTFSPTGLGAAPATLLTVNDDAGNTPQTANLTGTGITPVTLTPATLAFSTVVVSEQATKNVTLTNNTTTAITIDSITGLTGVYTQNTTNSTCPVSPNNLAAGASCIIAVNLTATVPGSQPGSATVTYNPVGTVTTTNVGLTMTATADQPVTFSASAIGFVAQFVGTTSASKSIVLYNRQTTVPLNISGITVTGTNPGDFAVTSLCPIVPISVPANSHCTISVTFTPKASGGRVATLTVADDALGSPQTVELEGSGNAPVLLSAPGGLTTYAAPVGSVSAYRTITMTNEGGTALTNISFQISGDFEQTSTTCGATPPYTLAAGAACNVTVSFAPTIGGKRSGQIQFVDSAYTSPQVLNLQGTGTSPLTISPTGLAFSSQLVNTVSPAKSFTLTNHESESETFTLTPSGSFSASSNCVTGVIAAQTSCTVFVHFAPTTVTPPSQSGSIVITDSAPGGSALTESLTGAATATNPAAAVAVVSPGAGAAGTNVNVVITGNGWTHFSPSSVITFVDTNSATYAADITVSSFTEISPNQINATLTLAGGGGVVYGARNIKVTTPLTAGGTETAQLLSAFIIADPSLEHTITAVSPAFGSQGQTLTVNLTAAGTNFVQGTTFANFGDGITVDQLIINGLTTATATITISNTTPIGYRTITMVTGGEFATSVLTPQNNPIFQIGPNSATFVSLSPNSEPQGFAGPLSLTATGTHFLQNATTVSIGNVTVGDVIVTSPTTATVQITVPQLAALGIDNATVSTGGEIATLANAFTITGATPALLSVAPSSAQQGQSTSVVITGNAYTAFNACPGGVITATFTGQISSPTVTVNGAHQVTVPITVTQDAPTGGITANLTCGGAGSATIFPFGFTITPSASLISNVTPNSVPQGGQVTLTVTGVNTSWVQGTTQSTFYPGGVPVPLVNETIINSATSAQLAISVPTTTPPGTYGFYMATGGQIVSASINVYANTPSLTMSPANGLVPAAGFNSFPVSFTGQFTHFSQTATLPVIAGEGVTLTGFTVNNLVGAIGTINIEAGAATGPRLVTFTTGGEIVTTYFNVTSTPVGLISIAPYHAPQSDTLNVAIVGLNTHFTANGPNKTAVIFGGPQITVNSVTVSSPTNLIANISTSYTPPGGVLTPTPPGWNTVYVNSGAEQLLGGFSVDAPATPTILSVSPDSAAQGSTDNPVTITGSLTNWQQGVSELILGAGVTVANLEITGPTTATATISVSPTAPVGGNSVIMITGTEYDSGTGFSVTPSAAYISSVEPNFTCPTADVNYIAGFNCTPGGTPTSVPVIAQLQTITLNVTGVGTHWLQGETTLSFGPGVVIDSLTINSPTTASTQITVLSSAPVGFATATAFTAGESASLQQAIDIEEGSPTLLAISPGGAQQGATLNLVVLGRFTNWSGIPGQTPNAAFNQGIMVNSVTVNDSETLTLNITVSPWAVVDTSSPCGHVLTITSASEQVSTSSINENFCVAIGAQEITSVTPNEGVQGSTQTVTIVGSQTNFLNGQTTVSFNDGNIAVGVANVVNGTTLTVPIAVSTSSATGFKNVTVTTYGQVENQVDAYTVSPGVATLNEAIPDQAEQGVQNLSVRLIGQYSHFNSNSTATFGAGIVVVGTPTWVSATEIDAVINIDPLSYVGGRNVTVTSPGVPCSDQPPVGTNFADVTYAGCTPGVNTGTGKEIVNNYVFTIIPGPAIITNVSPNTGNEGQEIVFNITGSATHWQQNFTQFYIAGGGSDITVNDVIINSATSATVDISIATGATAGPRSIYMVTAGESLTDSGAFVVTGGVPAISYLTPNNAQPGTTELQVTVVGNAYTRWGAGSTVSFGPGITLLSSSVNDESHIAADIAIGPTCTSLNVPAGCAQYGYRTVVVQTGTQGLTGNFQVVAPPPPPTPYVWYESPSSGIPGQTLTVNFVGANTEWNPSPTAGTTLTGWNASITVNSFQITSATTATTNITIAPGASASTSGLTFTTNGTAAYGTEVDNASFTVVIAQPVLSIVDPGSGMQGAQNITVNILGQFTAFDNTTTFSFGGPGSGITVNGPPTILGPAIATQSVSIGLETPTGGYSVIANTPDAPAIAQVVGGAGFSVTPSLALISAVAPNTSAQGTTITVDVQGSNTHWDGSTVFSFGDGIVVTSAIVNNNTDATLTLAIPPLATEGTTSASARTGGEVANLSQAFVVTAGTPLLLSSGPGSIEQQGSAVFTILSQSTTWSSATPPVVSYGDGIILTNVNVTGPTSMTVDGYVLPTTEVGYRNLTVTTGTQVLSIANAVYVGPGPAVINSVTPNTGGQGVELSSVAINGINTHWLQGVTTLTFPGVLINSYVVNSPTSITASITVDITVNPGPVNVTTTTGGEVATESAAFYITQTQAELAYINPTNLMQGATSNLTITGIDTAFSAASTVTVSNNVAVNSVTYNSPTSLTANVTVAPTATLGYRTVTVNTPGTTPPAVASSSLFQVVTGPAEIAGLNPAAGGQGRSVTVQVTGSQTHFSTFTTASFGGGMSVTGISIVSNLIADVTVSIPNSTPLGTYNVTLTTGGEVATILGGFTVSTGSPLISVVNPPTGTQGITINVTLTGLFTNFVNGTSVANFGSGITVNTTTVSNSTSAVANITISPTATLGSRNVTVTTGGEVAGITGGFTVLAGVPALTSASPAMGQAGTTLNVIVDGVFTTFQQGFSSVSFGGGISVNAVIVNNTGQLTANITVASNASVGNRTVSVTTDGQTLNLNNGFSVTPGTPVITQINPNIGIDGQTENITIYGQYTSWVQGTTTANFGANITVNTVTVNNPTQLTVNITIGAGAPLGPVTVVTTTGAEVENVPGGFTIQPTVPPSPTLVSLSPGANAGGMPLNSDIVAVFSEPMKRTTLTTSTVLLYLISNPGQGYIPVTGTVTVDATGRVMTFTPASLLAVNSQYYLELQSGIQSATGIGFGNYDVSLYTTAASATASPTVIAANPPANSTVGTNVSAQLYFSGDMNQNTQTGMTLSTGGNPVAGTYGWNSSPNCCWGPGTLLTFTPTAPLAAGATYTVAWTSAMTDTAGNALTPGSFTFNTGAGPDTAYNYSGSYWNGQTNVGTNTQPQVVFSKVINPIDINTGTLLLYNNDSGKYIGGTVTVAANGLSATFSPTVPLLPETYYTFYQAGGDYDADGNYMYGMDAYFTTGVSSETTAPTVTFISPSNTATSAPLNTQILVKFSAPINPNILNVITVTPSGLPPIAGTASLASDSVTLTFVPTVQLAGGKTYTVEVSGFQDLAGNVGTLFSSTFTTATSAVAISVSTGFNAGGQLITTPGTADANWTVQPTGPAGGPTSDEALGLFAATTTSTPPCVLSGGVCEAPQPLYIVGPGIGGWYGGWPANGPQSDWINMYPTSEPSNTFGVYSTRFTIPNPVPSNLCLVGAMGIDDNGELGINGTAITGNISTVGSPLSPINIPISSYLVVGSNTLSLAWGGTDNNYEAFRLQAEIETCGSSVTGGLSISSSTPSNNATAVATSTTITMNFNNTVDPATVNTTTLPVMIGWNSNQEVTGNYVVTGNQVVFTPATPFPTSTQIYVGACGGPLDLAGDSAGNCYTQLLTFQTGTTATAAPDALQVAAFSPASGATNVGLRSPVTATFNRSINLGTLNTSDWALFSGDGQSPWCTGYTHSQDDASVSFNCYPLPSSDPMTAILSSGIQDWQGNALTPLTTSFTTSPYDSNTNGSIISVRPGNGASGVNPNLPLVLYSNLPINASTANNGLEVAQNNVLDPGTIQVLDNGYTLEFTPSAPFTPGALIQWWTLSTLSETTYNTPVNADSGYFYVAASTSTLAPTIQATSPSNGDNPAPLNVHFDTQFNTPLNPSTVINANIYLYDGTNGTYPAITITQPQPNEVLVVPNANLTPNHYIYLYFTNGLQSTTSVPSNSPNWYVYTGTAADTTTPTVVSAVPYSGATNVGVNVSPGVVFSKSIDPVSLNSSTFQVLNGGTPLAGTYWFSSSDTRIEFVPNAPLPPSTTLTININGVTDWEGHSVTYNSSFQTGPGPDFITPTVVFTSIPNYGSIPTNGMMTVQFSESMDVTSFTAGGPAGCGNFYLQDQLSGDGIGCIPVTLTWNASQTVAYLVPNSPLAAGRTYVFYVYGGTDLAGNAMTAVYYTIYADATAETAAPTVIAFNPIGGKTGLGTNAIIEAQFSAPIDPNTISGVTLTNGGSPVTTTVSAFAGDTIVQLTPAVPLTPETTYTMNIIGVKDPSGNTVATVTNSFTTGTTYDITAPAVTLSDPVNYASVGTNVIPKFVFNKPLNPIYVSTGSFRIYLVDSGQFIPTTVTLSASGLEVTLTPQIPLLPNTEYEFSGGWDSGPQDQNGNFVNLPYYYFYTNGGADTTAPTVTVNPLNNATGIPLNAQVKATLSVPMDPTSWTQNSIQLLNGSTPVAGTVSYTNSTTLTFVPTANLTAGVTYTVKVSGFTDSNGNTVATSSTTFTAGTAASTSGLTVVSVSPGYGTTGNSNTSTITIVFSQVLDPNTVNSATLKVMNGWNSNDPIAGTYAVTGNTVVFTPSSAYPPGTNVTVGECGGPTDVLGDVFQNGGCYYSEFESFTVSSANPGTGSDNPFTVLSVSPASGATNVGRDQPVSVTFSNSIAQNSGNGYNSQLYAAQTLQNYGSYTLSSDNRTFTFNEGALYNGTTYTIYFPAGGISDQWGNTLASPFTSTFSTVADPTTVIPTVIGMSPGTSTSSSVPVNSLLTLYLSHQVNPATLTGNVTVTVNGQVYAGNVQADASGYQVQYTPTVAFPNSATVQWFFSGNVEDIYGNYFTGTSGYFYTVPTPVNPATAQPTLVTVSPDQGSSLMPTNGEIDLQFSQPLNAATVTTGNFFQNAGTAIAYTVSLISPTVVRISPPAGGWIPSYSYYGFCNNNSVMGTNGVAAASNCWDTYFFTTAGPNTTGGTVNIGPPNNSQNVGTNAYIRLNFSEPADRTTVNSTNVQVKIGSNPVQGSFTYNYSGDDMVGANFYPTNPLPTGSTVTVAVSNLLDYAGNEFNEPSISFQVGSAPDYTTPTAALDFNNGQSGVATNASFNCHYSEPMDPSSINSGNTFVWSYLANAIVPSTITVSADMMTATITPNAPLFQNTQYYYACYNALDLTGNAMSNTNAYFYTGSNTVSAGPVLLYANPPSGMTNVPIDTNQGPYNSTSLNLLFNEPVATESLGNITLSYVPVAEPLNTPVSVPIGAYANDGNYIVAVALPYALLPNMIYTYNVAGVTDLNGIPTASTTSSFTTGTGYDFTNAGVTATNPVSSLPSSTVLTGVPASVTVTFSEALDPVLINTNEVYLRTHNTQTYVPATIGISSSATPSVGTTITLTPITPLLDTTIYDIYYYANPWWMTDIAGNGAYENTGILTTFTTGTTAAVNGVCGTANTGTFSSPPTTNLCSTGTVSGQTNNGTYGWTCNGNYGGTNASCSATITPVSSCVAAPTGLQGWWTGNDTPNDSGPNAYNGTLKYGATYGLGEVKDAFNLTGNAVSTSNEFVLIGQPVPANLQITNAITLSAWIYVTSYPANNGGGAYGFILGSQSDGNYGGATIFYDGTTNNNGWANIPVGHIQFQIGDGSAWHETDTYTQVPLNQWVLITATRTANNPAQIYYNGVLQASTNLSAAWNGNISYPSSDWFAIGQEVNEDRAFNGLIDEAQIYSTALTAAQVQAIYNAGNAGVCP